VEFCIRDDDTSFFTSPEQLERAYGDVSRLGPVSLAVVPFHRAGPSKGVPERYRNRWSIHPLHDNQELVDYLRTRIAEGRFEPMLHGYYHDEPDGRCEFQNRGGLAARVKEGRAYLEDLLGARIRVFVPPRNAIGSEGLNAIAQAGLHLGGVAGIRAGWPWWSVRSWVLWRRLRGWKRGGGAGVPWVLDLGDHREISGNAVTPVSWTKVNDASFDAALSLDGVFCAATHYWELGVASQYEGEPPVGEQLHRLITRARANRAVAWRSVGDVLSQASASLP
jgi:hypothetical protein